MKILNAQEKSTSPLARELNLIDELNDVLNRHPIGVNFKLMLVGDSISVSNDEVLIQEVNSSKREITIRPIKIDALAIGSAIHATNLIDITDANVTSSLENGLNAFVEMSSHVPKHLVRFADGKKIHVTT